jgi:hypothetical protein
MRPIAHLIAQHIQSQCTQLPLRECSWIQAQIIPTYTNVCFQKGQSQTLQDQFQQGYSKVSRTTIEFLNSKASCFQSSLTLSTLIEYSNTTCQTLIPTDIILGNDFLIAVGINCNGVNQTITWLEKFVPYKPRDYFKQKQQMCVDFLDSLSPDEGINDNKETNVTPILEAKYQKSMLAQKQTQLTLLQQDELAALFSKYPKLFSGGLGLVYPHCQLHLELVKGTRPVHKRPYPVPQSNLEVLKTELEHLVQRGMLSCCGASE